VRKFSPSDITYQKCSFLRVGEDPLVRSQKLDVFNIFGGNREIAFLRENDTELGKVEWG
jgi:hypothetical protein